MSAVGFHIEICGSVAWECGIDAQSPTTEGREVN